jgi:sugar phosphate isomerase/epimerase
MARYSLGISATSYLRVWETIDTLEFLERCDGFGAAGIQAVLHGDPLRIRAEAEKRGMYVEAMVPLPSGDDTAEFEQGLKDAQAAGATALRAACLGTRRYETFKTFDAWQAHVAESERSLESALPLLDRYKIPLGLENHKDWTAEQLASLAKKYSSEYFGVCLDFGNNISLLDLPMDAIEKLAPYTVTTHVKDIAVDAYADGILLSEVILGTGLIDLPRAVSLITESRPKTRMNLEMITRDPLKIPLLREEYWGTLSDKKAADLARTLHFVNHKKSAGRLPQICHLTPAEVDWQEDENVKKCLVEWQRLSL